MASYLKLSTSLQESWTVLRDLAGAYQQDKPELDGLIRKAGGKGFIGEADRLQALLDAGGYDSFFDHQGDLESLRFLLNYVDGLLDDPTLREELRNGIYDTTLVTMIRQRLNILHHVAAKLTELQEAGLPAPVEGPTYNSMQLCAEMAGVCFSLIGFLGISRPADAGSWLITWADVIPEIDGFGFWFFPDPWMFPVWRNISSARERFAGKPNYGLYKDYAPNGFYFKRPLKRLSQYESGEVYAALHMLHGGLKYAEEAKGALPMGMALDPATGNVIIQDADALRAGTFSEIFIGIHDQLGGYFEHPLEVVIQRDVVPVYYVAPRKPANQYYVGDEIASLEKMDEYKVKSARIVSGQLPAGLRFHTGTGNFSVQTIAQLEPGTYALQVRVITVEKVDVVLDVELVIEQAEEFEFGPSFVAAVPKPVSEYVPNDVVAVMKPGAPSQAMFIYQYNSFPSGFQFQAPDKMLWVSETPPSPGQVQIDIVLEYEDGSKRRSIFKMDFYPDDAFAYDVAAPKGVYDYISGDVIATPPASAGTIVSAWGGSSNLSGSYAYNVASDGVLTVMNPSSLIPGDFFMEIWTETEAFVQKTYLVPWSILVGDAVTYSVADPQAAGTYQLDQQVAVPQIAQPVVQSFSLTSPVSMLPPGVGFDAMTGVFAVTDPTAMVSGSWTLDVKASLLNGSSEDEQVTIDVLEA